jgi:hypothetical protein
MRIGLQTLVRRSDADLPKCVARALARCLPIDRLMGLHCLDHLGVDAQDRVERHHRVLENHRDPGAS